MHMPGRPVDLDRIPIRIRRAACAYHEAGHIVVGWHHRRYITHAWLRPPQGMTGETCFAPYQRGFRADRKEDLARAEVEVTILCAGHCGEMIFWDRAEGLKWFPGDIHSHADDVAQMQPYLALLAPRDEAAFRAKCARAATAILYRPAMMAAQAHIATALLERWRIEPAEVDAIIAAMAAA
jgi:hypothetical protein